VAIRLRSCRISDIPAVLELWTRATDGSVGDNAKAIRLRLRRDRELFLIALDGKRVIGSLIGGWDGWRATMARLAVDPAYRRRGVARRLVQRVEREFCTIGAVRVSCLVLDENRLARAFWQSAGYSHDPETVRYKKDLSSL
jgi:ribosomal protein S18 acetylase RimI-like enzyme